MRSTWVLPMLLLWVLGCQHRFPEDLLSVVPDAEAVGIYHQVKEGETLASICRQYGADIQEVAELNGLIDASHLRVGERVFIPDVIGPPGPGVPNAAAGKSVVQQWPGEFIWPIEGVVTSQFGVRWGRRHDGIDIAAPVGTSIHAAADGSVLFAGEEGGYGNLVILKHQSGRITVYAHNRANLVQEGDQVKKGQAIGEVGQTGRATGPHVHFEIREGKKPRNPLFFLPGPK